MYQCVKQSEEHQGPAFQSYLHATETCFLIICISVQTYCGYKHFI